jgi:hypothetical protein
VISNIWGYVPVEDHRHPVTDETADAHQLCPACQQPLACTEDYIGAGSHYWVLRCDPCDTRYVYDTYRFRVEAWP